MPKSKTRRDRLIEAINKKIIELRHLQPEFEFRKGWLEYVGRRELVRIAIKTAQELANRPGSRSDFASYLAEVLTLPQLTGKGIGFIAQKAVTGGKRYRGVAEHLRVLQKHGVDISLVVSLFLLEKPKTVREILQRLPATYDKKHLKTITRELGIIFWWHQQREKGHERMQRFMEALRRRHRAIYRTPLERAMFTREDVAELRAKGVPEEVIQDMLKGIIPEQKPREYKPRIRKKIVRRPRLVMGPFSS
jgi:hypothetical protein